MIARRAQYLLRFDDLCPTFSVPRWERFLPLMEEVGLRPILAVVPDNRDAELMAAAPDAEFWKRMRALESAGSTIGLHGWQHLCRSEGKSLAGLHRRTEFAGADEETQFVWIEKGLGVLRGEGLQPRIWVAPRHGTDEATLRALRRAGIEYVSDGMARRPYLQGGVTWIPQQLWGPEEHKSGLWTICVHSNEASDEQVARLREFAKRHASQFTSFERVAEACRPGRLGLMERADAAMRGRRVAIRAWRNELRRGASGKDAMLRRAPSAAETGCGAAGCGRELPNGRGCARG